MGRLVRIWLLWRRTTKRSELTPSRQKERRMTRSIKFDQNQIILSLRDILLLVFIKHNSKIVACMASISVLISFTVMGAECSVSYDSVVKTIFRHFIAVAVIQFDLKSF